MEDQEYRWDLTPIFPDESAWQTAYKEVEQQVNSIEVPTIQANPETILVYLQTIESTREEVFQVYMYTKFQKDEDLNDPDRKQNFDRANQLRSSLTQKSISLEPLLSTLPPEQRTAILTDPRFSNYTNILQDIFDRVDSANLVRPEAHSQAAGLEERFRDQSAQQGQLLNKLEFGTILNEAEEEEPFTGRHMAYLFNPNTPQMRERAYRSYYEAVGKRAPQFAQLISQHIQDRQTAAQNRGYQSSIEAALAEDRVPIDLYHNLINQVRNKAPLFQEYLERRRQRMSLDKIQMWDLLAPISKETDLQLSPEDAKRICIEAVQPLGPEYVRATEVALRPGQVDWFPRDGKPEGHYSWRAAYGKTPYILTNFRSNVDSLFRLVHEAGHSAHAILTDSNQPFSKSNFPLVLEEIAAYTNEEMLLSYLANSDNPQYQAVAKEQTMFKILMQVFRQAIIADFELALHEKVIQEGPQSGEQVSQLYEDIFAQYYGDMVRDGVSRFGAQRIPQLFSNFYVWKYAHGNAAAQHTSYQILDGNPEAYLNLLKSGNKDYPLQLMRDAGLDSLDPQFYDPVYSRFQALLEDM